MLEKAAGYFEKTQKITYAIGNLIGNKAFQDREKSEWKTTSR
jgi:hypothetical protein